MRRRVVRPVVPQLPGNNNAELGSFTNPLPSIPSSPDGVGAPVGSGSLVVAGQDQGPPNGVNRGWWQWLRALLQSTAIKSVQLPVPELFLIPGGSEFFALQYATTTGVGVTTFPDIMYSLPKSQEGWISEVTFFMGGAAGGQLAQTNYATFTLTINGTPVPGWANVSTFPRVAFSVQEEQDAQIRVPLAGTIGGYANNTDGGTYVVGLGYYGHRWPKAAAQRWVSGLSR